MSLLNQLKLSSHNMEKKSPKIGDIVEVEIIGMQDYGAFVKFYLDNSSNKEKIEQKGLIHISEIRTGFIENIYDVLKIGEEVQVQVVDLDEYTGKASLSIRTLEEEKHQLPRRRRFSSDRVKYGFAPLARMMPIWTKEAISNLNKKKS